MQDSDDDGDGDEIEEGEALQSEDDSEMDDDEGDEDDENDDGESGDEEESGEEEDGGDGGEWEDIYGRKRSRDGAILNDNATSGSSTSPIAAWKPHVNRNVLR